jgi:hypothetical protein
VTVLVALCAELPKSEATSGPTAVTRGDAAEPSVREDALPPPACGCILPQPPRQRAVVVEEFRVLAQRSRI